MLRLHTDAHEGATIRIGILLGADARAAAARQLDVQWLAGAAASCFTRRVPRCMTSKATAKSSADEKVAALVSTNTGFLYWRCGSGCTASGASAYIGCALSQARQVGL